MSGIVGTYHTDGSAPEPEAFQRAIDRMGHRAVDGATTWYGGPVGFGHLAFHTTPEAILERYPLQSPSGRYLLTADARLDNREEVWGGLSLREPLPELTDADLILAAYERWGEACPKRLIGAFAFAVWDTEDRVLFVARDSAGFRPLYYHHVPHHRFTFATELPALLLLGASDRPDLARVADYLADIVFDNEYTFYSDIRRLPPAHALVVTETATRLVKYWALDPERELHLRSDDEYGEAFRDVMGEAVRSRLRSPAPIGLLLSGGLDSSAIAVVAERLLRDSGSAVLRTYSNVFPDTPECDERPYIEAVLGGGRYEASFVEPALTTRPLTALKAFVRTHGQPIYAPAASQLLGIYGHARDGGTRVFLDGHGGDEVASEGLGYLKELALAGRWGKLLREVALLDDQESGGGRPSLYLLHVLFGLSGALQGVPRAGLVRRAVSRGMGLLQNARGRTPRNSATSQEMVAAPLAAEVDLAARVRSFRSSLPVRGRTTREAHYLTLTSPLQPHALEAMSSVVATAGIERRSPFWDRRVVEFSLSLPPDQIRRNGRGRHLLRHALRDSLPTAVYNRTSKTRFNENVIRGVTQNDVEEFSLLVEDPARGLDGLIDAGAVRSALVGVEDRTTLPQALILMKLAALRTWMV